jgi:hypothetical protein
MELQHSRPNPAQLRMSRRNQGRGDGAAHRGVASGRRPPEPARGRLGKSSLGEQHGEIELAAKVTAPCRLAIPVRRLLEAAAASPAFFQTPCDHVHRPSMPLSCGAQIPAQGPRPVGRDSAAVEQQIAEVVFPPVVPALRRGTIAHRRARKVARHAPAILVAAADHVHGLGFSLRRRALKPTECRRLIVRHPAAAQ